MLAALGFFAGFRGACVVFWRFLGLSTVVMVLSSALRFVVEEGAALTNWCALKPLARGMLVIAIGAMMEMLDFV